MEGPAVAGAGFIDIDTKIEEEANGFDAAAEDGKHDGVNAIGSPFLRVGAETDEGLHHFDVAGLGGAEKGSNLADAEEAGAAGRGGGAGMEVRATGDKLADKGDFTLGCRFMQGSAAGAVAGIDIDTVVEHLEGDWFMTAAQGDKESIRAVRGSILWIGLGRQQGFERFQVTRDGGKEQRRVAFLRALIGVGASGEQLVDDRGETFGGGPHEGRLSGSFFESVGVRPGAEQSGGDGRVLGGNGCHQGGFAIPAGGIRVGFGGQEGLDGAEVAVGGGEAEWGFAVFVGEIGIGAGGEEELEDVDVVAAGGPGQGSGAIGAGGIDAGAGLEQRLNPSGVPFLNGAV